MNYKKIRRPAKFMMFFLFGILAVLLFGYIVMLLWNAILPALLGVSAITYWKAVGVLILSKILFGSFGKGCGHHRRPPFGSHGHLREKYMNMTDGERRQFRDNFRQHCHRPSKGNE
jgi:hypothetical protein